MKGDRIKVRGTPNKGNITAIVEDYSSIQWKGKLPQFIAIKLDNGNEYLANPNQLKKSNS